MRKTKELKNIGIIIEDDIVLSDSMLTVFIPLETESEMITRERERCESWLERGVRERIPDIDLNKCTLWRETDLFINTGHRNKNGKYSLEFSIGFMMWIEDENGKEIYADMFDNIDVELSEEDKAYVKRIMAEKIVEVLV